MKAPGIPSGFMQFVRRSRRRLAQFPIGGALAQVAARISRHPVRRVLLVSDGIAYTSEQQFAPLLRYRRQIASRTGIVFSFMIARDAWKLSSSQLKRMHAIGLKLSFSTPATDAAALASHVFGAAKKAGIQALVFDGDDDSSVLWPDVLAACDHYIKKHHYTDMGAYTAVLTGKSNLTDYVHRTHGWSFADNIIPSSGGLEPRNIEKIVLGWNIALDNKIADLARDLPVDARIDRDIDLLCRASVPEGFWTFPMRDAAVQAIRNLSVGIPHPRPDRSRSAGGILPGNAAKPGLCQPLRLWRDLLARFRGHSLRMPLGKAGYVACGDLAGSLRAS